MNKKVLALVFIIIIAGAAGAAAWYFFIYIPEITAKPWNPHGFAIVFATGGLGDKSFNDGCYEGATLFRTTHSINFTYTEATVIADYEPMLRAFAAHDDWRNPYELIISVGFDQADAIQLVAADYPTQRFAIIDVNWINATTYPHIAQITFNEHEGSALVGALAGLATQTDKIGFVGGMDIPLIHKFAAGYFWGANYTNDQIDLLTGSQSANITFSYVGSWVDTTTGETQADLQYAAGSDIIFAAAGRSGLGVIDSALSNNGSYPYPTWYIGVDSPQMYLGIVGGAPTGHMTVGLSSMLKRVDVAVYTVCEAVFIDFNFQGGLNTFTLANGGLDWELNETMLVIPDPWETEIANLKAAIIANPAIIPTDYTWL
jgi:basic membrane protein A